MAERSCVSGCTTGWAHPQILTRHHTATTHRPIDTCFSLTGPEAQRLDAVGRLDTIIYNLARAGEIPAATA
jgi:hypothetical protein